MSNSFESDFEPSFGLFPESVALDAVAEGYKRYGNADFIDYNSREIVLTAGTALLDFQSISELTVEDGHEVIALIGDYLWQRIESQDATKMRRDGRSESCFDDADFALKLIDVFPDKAALELGLLTTMSGLADSRSDMKTFAKLDWWISALANEY